MKKKKSFLIIILLPNFNSNENIENNILFL